MPDLKTDYYRQISERLDRCGYRLVQYIPSRFSFPLGQEAASFLSFSFNKDFCIFNASVFMPLYHRFFRMVHPREFLLFNIFFAGKSFRREDLAGGIFEEGLFETLCASGFFQRSDNSYRSLYRFIPLGDLIIAGKFDERDKDYVHTGYDTVILYRHIRRQMAAGLRPAKALEIGCGTGFLSLYMASRAQTVDAVDINPEAVRLTNINSAINGIGNVTAFESDIYNNVKGKYDYIFSNPPFEFLPDGMSGALHSFGGEFGLGLTSRILEGLDEHLSRSGRALILSSSYIKDSGDDLLRQMVQGVFAGKKFDVTLTQLFYRISQECYRHYRKNNIAYAVSYMIDVRRSDTYRLKIVPMGIVTAMRERARLIIQKFRARRMGEEEKR